MKTYTLKLTIGSSYSLYDGETLLSDAELTTLFNNNAGEAYFIFDFNSGTPGSTTQVNILDSSRNTVMYRNPITGTVAEDRTYKGVWTAGTAPNQFTSFVELKGKALDEVQLSFLMSKIKEAQAGGIKTLTTADYDYPSNNPTAVNANNLGDGIYIAGEQISVHMSLYGNSTFTKGGMIIKSDGAFLTHLSGTNSWAWKDSFSSVSSYNLLSVENLANNLTSTDTTKALSAPQGKALNEKIGDLTTLTTTAKTSAVAAINELDSDLGKVEPLSGSGAPTTSTAGTVGQFYVDTATGDIYYLSAIVEESGQPDTYTWESLAGLATNTTFWGQTASNGAVDGNMTITASGVDWERSIGGTDTQYNPKVIFGYRGHGETVPYVKIKSDGADNNSNELVVTGDAGEGITANTFLDLKTHQLRGLADGTAANHAVNKSQLESLITMTTTDPGEGSPLDAGHLIGVYE